MNNRRQLAELLLEVGQLEQEIAQRNLSKIAPWLVILDETDRPLVETYYTLQEADRPAFVQSNDRLAYIASVWTKEVRSPADLERLLYPERLAERERMRQEREAQRQAQLELDREKWTREYHGSNNVMRQAARNWFQGHNLPFPDGQPVEPKAAPQLPRPAPAPETVAPSAVETEKLLTLGSVEELPKVGEIPESQAPKKTTPPKTIPFLSLGGSGEATPKTRCGNCGGRLQPSRSNPDLLTCSYCGTTSTDNSKTFDPAMGNQRRLF